METKKLNAMKFNRIAFSFVVATLLIFSSSCTRQFKSTPVAPVNVQVNVSMADLEYVGEVVGTSTQSYLFGVLPIGGRRFHTGVLSQQSGFLSIPANRGTANALYDALQSQADADFVLPVSVEQTTNVMFLGNVTTYTVRAKAYRIKTTL